MNTLNFPEQPELPIKKEVDYSALLAREAVQSARVIGAEKLKAVIINNNFKTENYYPANTGTGDNLIGKADTINFNGNSAIVKGKENDFMLSFLPTPYFNKAGNLDTSQQFDFLSATVDFSKNIRSVDSTVLNQEGFITEITGVDGYSFSITIILIETLTEKPDLLLNNLEVILKTGAPINVKSDFINNRGVEQILVKNYSAPYMSDKINYYAVSVSAVSVEPDLFILEDF